MFLKQFRVKSNTKLKTTERRRVRQLLMDEFHLEIEDVESLVPQKKGLSVLKLITHGGQSVSVYMVDKEPLFFSIDNAIYPTVYMMWQCTHILPYLTMWPHLTEKICNGADLMLPGVVVKGPMLPFRYGTFKQGDRIAINTTANKAALAVGISAMSSIDMFMAEQRGKAIKVLHSYGDKLWELGEKIVMPELGPPDEFEEDSTTSATITEPEAPVISESLVAEEYKPECLENINESPVGLDTLSVTTDVSGHDTEVSSHEVTEKLDSDVTVLSESIEKVVLSDDNILSENSSGKENEKSLSKESIEVNKDTKSKVEEFLEMDEILIYCFLKALKMTVKKGDLPLLTSNFYKLHMIPSCPLGSEVDIKKSSFKKLSKFLNAMEEKGVVKVKELSKGVESIISIDQSHELLREFVDLESSKTVKSSPSMKHPTVTDLYTITAAVLPVLSRFGFRKGDMVTLADLRKYITEYVKQEKLQDPLHKSFVNINNALQQIVQNPNTLAMKWEDLMELFITHMTRGYKMSLPGEKPTSHKGKIEFIDIQTAKRTGNKKVTLVNNLELYGIDIHAFARECQHGVAASTSISMVQGRRSQQLLVQGNQVLFVFNLLTSKYQIPKRYIKGLENAPRPKK